MFKNIFTTSALLVVTAGAQAAILSGNHLQLHIDAAGVATIKNVSSDLNVDFLDIASPNGDLIETNWSPVDITAGGQAATVAAAAGDNGWFQMGIITRQASRLAEGTTGGAPNFPAGFELNYGQIVDLGSVTPELEFFYGGPEAGVGNVWQGEVVVVPEPASVALIAAGALALVRRRRSA